MAILFALFTTLSFIACSSNDDDTSSTETIKENIVGMWQTSHISGWIYDDTEDENLIKVDQDIADDSEHAQRIVFKGDGRSYIYFYGSTSHQWISLSDNMTYDISGNKIIIYYKNEVSDIYTVVSLNGDTVVVQYTMDEGPQYKTNLTCKRVY